MSLPAFLRSLFDDGHVRVGAVAGISPAEWEEARAVLAQREQAIRLTYPGHAPRLDPAAAAWGAEIFYRACQGAVFRDLDAEQLEQMLARPCPTGEPAAVHYSVDLTLAFLPDLTRFATAAAADDPLCVQLQRLATVWPLSSVGMKLAEPPAIDALIGDENLFQYYVDRVLAREDRARQSDQRVALAIAAVHGAYQPDLKTLRPEPSPPA